MSRATGSDDGFLRPYDRVSDETKDLYCNNISTFQLTFYENYYNVLFIIIIITTEKIKIFYY